MDKSDQEELTQLKMAIDFLASVFEEGSLVEHIERPRREEMARILQLLLSYVADLPVGVPSNLVEAAAVRALVGAAENAPKQGQEASGQRLTHDKHQAELTARLRGHNLAHWRKVGGDEGNPEYEAMCQNCGGVTFVSLTTSYVLLSESCVPREDEPTVDEIDSETVVALWDLTQRKE